MSRKSRRYHKCKTLNLRNGRRHVCWNKRGKIVKNTKA
jgi:hypothetical protein